MMTPIDFSSVSLVDLDTGKQVKMEGMQEIRELTLTPDENDEIRLSDDRVLISSVPITIPVKILNKDHLKAFSIYVLTGNDLYLRFPKKLRRKKNG